jgi:hypothetical protein
MTASASRLGMRKPGVANIALTLLKRKQTPVFDVPEKSRGAD